MTTTSADPRLLLLDPADNIAVATRELPAGTALQLPEGALVLRDAVDIGHKFARRAIAQGERIVKYQAPIGSARCAIAAGEYVHTHNMQSDYLPTYTLLPGAEFSQESSS